MKIGSDSISLRLGSVEIPKAYLGDELVHGEEQPKNYIGEWRDGYRLSNRGKSIEANSDYMLTPYFKVLPGHSITVDLTAISTLAVSELPNNFTSISQSHEYWNQNQGLPKTFTTTGSTYYIICNVAKSRLSTAYIKDNTTGEYIWKGESV